MKPIVPFFLVLQLLLLLALPFVLVDYARNSGLAAITPLQYGPLVQALLSAGLLSSGLSYITFAVRARNSVAKILLIVGAVLCGVILNIIWGAKKESGMAPFAALESFEGTLDLIAWLVLVLAAIAALVSLLEWLSSAKIDPRPWRMSFLCVDLPLFLGCLIVIYFKYRFQNPGSDLYLQLIVEVIPTPEGGTVPSWFEEQAVIHRILQVNFWSGFTAGAISVQVATSQAVSVATRILHQFLSGGFTASRKE